MDFNTAKNLLNKAELIKAFAKWTRQPMDVTDAEFRDAMDWSQAALVVSAGEANREA